MKYQFTIPGRLPCLNDVNEANRSNKFVGAKQKKRIEYDLEMLIKYQLKDLKITKKVNITHWWFEKDMRRDKDNIISAKKFIWDALVKAGTLQGDGWKQIGEIRDFVLVDARFPRIVIELEEV